MIKIEKQNIVTGNTVLAPQFEPTYPSRREAYEKLKKSQKQSLRKKQEKNIKNKVKVLRNIVLVFVIGVGIIARYAMIYNAQKELTKTKSEISTFSKENENLKVELVKNVNIQYVEEVATTKLHMIRAERKQAVYQDLTKDNFTKKPSKEIENGEKGILQKIKNILF